VRVHVSSAKINKDSDSASANEAVGDEQPQHGKLAPRAKPTLVLPSASAASVPPSSPSPSERAGNNSLSSPPSARTRKMTATSNHAPTSLASLQSQITPACHLVPGEDGNSNCFVHVIESVQKQARMQPQNIWLAGPAYAMQLMCALC
jgi:hypothetical protein